MKINSVVIRIVVGIIVSSVLWVKTATGIPLDYFYLIVLGYVMVSEIVDTKANNALASGFLAYVVGGLAILIYSGKTESTGLIFGYSIAVVSTSVVAFLYDYFLEGRRTYSLPKEVLKGLDKSKIRGSSLLKESSSQLTFSTEDAKRIMSVLEIEKQLSPKADNYEEGMNQLSTKLAEILSGEKVRMSGEASEGWKNNQGIIEMYTEED